MRKFFVCLLSLIPVLLHAQTDTIPMRKANRILVVTDRSAVENYKLIATTFLSNDYELLANAANALVIHTKEKPTSSPFITYQLSARALDGKIEFFGTYKSRMENTLAGASLKTFTYEIRNGGRRGSVQQITFGILDQVARQVNGTAYYQVEKNKRAALID